MPETARCANKSKTLRKQRRRYDNEPVDVDLELVGNEFPLRGEGEKSLTRRASGQQRTASSQALALIFILSFSLAPLSLFHPFPLSVNLDRAVTAAARWVLQGGKKREEDDKDKSE